MSAVKTGDKLEVNISEGWIRNIATQCRLTFDPWPDFILNIMRDGGLYPWLREEAPESAHVE